MYSVVVPHIRTRSNDWMGKQVFVYDDVFRCFAPNLLPMLNAFNRHLHLFALWLCIVSACSNRLSLVSPSSSQFRRPTFDTGCVQHHVIAAAVEKLNQNHSIHSVFHFGCCFHLYRSFITLNFAHCLSYTLFENSLRLQKEKIKKKQKITTTRMTRTRHFCTILFNPSA